MIDLSSLSIPPVSVVPEPKDGTMTTILSLAATAALTQGSCGVDQVMFSLARRCRELEARLNQIAEATELSNDPDCPPIVKLLDWFENKCEELSVRNKELEAKVERLKQAGRDFTPGLAESTYDG